MFEHRTITNSINWLDEDGVKIYTISANHQVVQQSKYLPRLAQMKATKNINWKNTAAFSIFHDGTTCEYLVLVWWGNGNELFTSTSVNVNGIWLEDPSKYSFCLYDMEVMWTERNIYIQTMDCKNPSIEEYRNAR